MKNLFSTLFLLIPILFGCITNSEAQVFTDRSNSKLVDGTTLDLINDIEDELLKGIATKLFNNKYEDEFRVQQYEAYRPINELRTALANQQVYSKFVNPTGIRVNKNKEITIYAEGIGEYEIKVLVANFGENLGTHPGNGKHYKINSDFYHTIKDGKNTFTSTIPGNLYISYYTSDYENAPKPTINIVSGEVCAYFDVTKHDNEVWKKLLAMPYEMLDIKGEHIGMTYPRLILKEECPDFGVELTKKHDEVVRLQWELMGLYKFNRVPKNPMFASYNKYARSPYAGGEGICAPEAATRRWCSVWGTPIVPNAWGLYHELGHINEMKGFRWQGTQEVTNNLYSCLVEQKLEKYTDLRYEFSQKEDVGDGLGRVINGPYQLYLNQVVFKDGINWNTYIDFTTGGGPARIKTRAKVCFMWQLQMYFGEILEMDAYPNFFEILRNSPLPEDTKTKQLNYYKYFCDAVEMDLTEIFVKGKMLAAYSGKMGREQIVITEADVNEVKDYVAAKNYPKPETSTIYYLTVRTLEMYKNKTPITNATVGTGVTLDDTKVIVDNYVWGGAVGFEVYNGDKVINSSVAYTGFATDDQTLVAFPLNATSIKAVAWNGSKKIIYQK